MSGKREGRMVVAGVDVGSSAIKVAVIEAPEGIRRKTPTAKASRWR